MNEFFRTRTKKQWAAAVFFFICIFTLSVADWRYGRYFESVGEFVIYSLLFTAAAAYAYKNT